MLYFSGIELGIGLAFHYVYVFGVPGYNILDDDWESRELNKEVTKLIQEKGFNSVTPTKGKREMMN